MNFADSVLVRLGDPASRGAVFDELSLANLVAAAYDLEAMPVEPPYSAVFDELTVGYVAPPVSLAEGGWSGTGGADRTELRVQLHGIGQPALQIDALWRGSLVVRTTTARDRIAAVAVGLPSVDVDPESVAELTLQVQSTPPPATPPTPTALPFAATVFVRDTGFSLATLLAESRLARTRVEELGLDVPAPDELRRRRRVVAVWVLPMATFDDAAWPGGGAGTPAQQRAARYARAGRWLAAEGIGLAAVN